MTDHNISGRDEKFIQYLNLHYDLRPVTGEAKNWERPWNAEGSFVLSQFNFIREFY